jgi:peroxiredoxin
VVPTDPEEKAALRHSLNDRRSYPMSLMTPLRRLGPTLLAVAALTYSGLAVARDSVQPGKTAPDFTAVDTAGKPVSLAGLKGKAVVLEWTNHGCPYVGKHYGTGTMQKLQSDATAAGVVWLTVISSGKGEQGYVEAPEADKLTADRHAAPSAVLLDPDGKLGHLYGATTTPHMFIIDKAGMLVYMGGIDDKPSTSPETVKTARPYVREALDALAAGKPIQVASTRPYGCSVKYSGS